MIKDHYATTIDVLAKYGSKEGPQGFEFYKQLLILILIINFNYYKLLQKQLQNKFSSKGNYYYSARIKYSVGIKLNN